MVLLWLCWILDLRVKWSSTQGQIMGLANGAIRGSPLQMIQYIICRIGLINKGASDIEADTGNGHHAMPFSIFETFEPTGE